MKFELYKDMVLTRDLPAERLRRGDIGKLVEHPPGGSREDGYNAEVFNALGDSIAVITVPESALESLREDEVWCVRSLSVSKLSKSITRELASQRSGAMAVCALANRLNHSIFWMSESAVVALRSFCSS